MMSRWLVGEGKYFEAIFDLTALPVEAAAKALVPLRDSDLHFFPNFISAASALQSPAQILRALSLLPALGDYSALLPLLRTLGRHPDHRVRSKAVKLLCQLRPNKSLIERQMLSTDTRVRANAIEALWHVQTAEAREILRSAVADSNHRVVANALVGLHLQHDGSAIETMIRLAAHSDALFRTAMAWAFGFILDPRARPTLEHLAQDPSGMVKKRALQSLLSLVDLPSQSQGDRPLAETKSTEPLPSAPQF
jgi:HEAT repeat protein